MNVAAIAAPVCARQVPHARASPTQPADTRLNEASSALYGGDPERALKIASEHLQKYPADVRALVLAARAHLAREEHRAAYDLLHKALVVNPADVDALYFLGVASSDLATREFDRLYALAPEGPRVHQLMARSFKLQEKLAEAAAEYELALRADPNLLDALLELAQIEREESKCDDAVALYVRAERVRPTFDGAYGLGVCHALLNQHAQAVNEFRQALEHEPQSAVAQFGLGSSLLQLGETTAAARALEQAVSLEPRMRQAYYLLGRVYRAMGLPERSARAFARADELANAERLGDQRAITGAAAPRRPVRRKNPR